jgi:hypothetical protein
LCDVVAGAFGQRGGALVAKALGCAHTEASGSLEAPGATAVGFRVAAASPPTALALEGSHRFAAYALEFEIDPLPGGRSRLSATSRAEFPGTRGRVYRALVIGSRGHVLAVNRVLRRVQRRAERPAS